MHFVPYLREKKIPFLSPLWKYMSSNPVDLVIVKYAGSKNFEDACTKLRKLIGETRGTDIGSIRNVYDGVRFLLYYKIKGKDGVFRRRLFMTKLTYKNEINPEKKFLPELTGKDFLENNLGMELEKLFRLQVSGYERELIKRVLGKKDLKSLSDKDIALLEQKGIIKERRAMLLNNTHSPQKRDTEMVPELALLTGYLSQKSKATVLQIQGSI